ncbi:glycosyltransferase family 32 protein [Enterococcus faecium]|uniref:glycosyltransferase family 32 protein n=1 Tax=Enterococcus faecium TaxID=1352 RepID=UPI002012B2F7|nr:glycosyltransferase [Enterococcus faecium]
MNNDTENNTLLLVWRKIKPEEIKNNLDNWRRKLPEFEIIEWNEQNFDINSIPFVKEAYDRKMFAFVSDVARLHALLTHGGVYLDTDIEIVKDFTPIINNYSAVFSLENNNSIVATSFIASEEKHPIIMELFEKYQNMNFIDTNGNEVTIPNTTYLTEIIKKQNFYIKNEIQELDGIALFPDTYFSSFNLETGKPRYTRQTYTVHHFSASWQDRSFHLKKNKETFSSNIRRKILYKIKRILLTSK